MNKLVRAYDILEEIKKNEEVFLVNGDIRFTKDINDIIEKSDWNKMSNDNVSFMKQSEKKIDGTYTTELKSKDDYEGTPHDDWFKINLNLMNDNKNITQHALDNPRFGFVKKIINRMMLLSTRYQEIFNNSATSLIGSLAIKITTLENKNRNIEEKIKDLEKCNENRISEIENRNEDRINEIENRNENRINELANRNEDRINNIENRNKYYEGIIDELKSHLEDEKSKTDELSKQLNDIKELNNNICNSIDGQSNWLKALNNQVQNNEAWLDNINKRVEGLDSWLGTTNKRIDACNELLSATPELGYQSYSQTGEDTIIMHILSKLEKNVETISYLDIGCNHYKNYNNTFRFYQKGMSGVLVEANPMLIDELKKFRPRDIILNYGVGIDASQILEFYIINGGGLSSFNKKAIDKVIKNDPDAFIERIEKIKIITINEIISNYCIDVPTIVSIDIEGDEYIVLESLDSNIYRPLIFIVETIEYRKNLTVGTKRNDIVDLMKTKGYLEFAFTGVNSIFIDINKIILE